MKRIALSIIMGILLCGATRGQAEAGFDQYYFAGKFQQYTFMPMVHYQSARNWYAEARYNYEALQTFSLFIGKRFEGGRNLLWSLTPLLGGAAGRFSGMSAGLNADFDWKKFSFSSQAQYSMSATSCDRNFLYSWSDLSWQVRKWIYTGISLQQTYGKNTSQTETGLLAGITFGNFSIPLYVFNPLCNERYFVVGINMNWKY